MVENDMNDAAAISRRQEAGKSLLASLRKMHLMPDILAWGLIHNHGDGHELIMITSLVDRIGSLPIYTLLFRAQDENIIDESVPLMDLSLYSPHSEIGHDFLPLLNQVSKTGHLPHNLGGQDITVESAFFTVGFTDPMMVAGSDLIYVKKSDFSAAEDVRRWNHVTKHFLKLAA